MLIKGIIASANYPRSTNSYESIATVTVGALGASYAEFTSIPSTYKHLQLRIFPLNQVFSGDVYMQFNSDTATNYYAHYLYGDGSSALAGTMGASDYVYAGFCHSVSGSGITDILDYTNTNKYKVTRTLMGDDRNGSGDIALTSGLWKNTSAITSIKIIVPSGSFKQYSSFALYGVKG